MTNIAVKPVNFAPVRLLLSCLPLAWAILALIVVASVQSPRLDNLKNKPQKLTKAQLQQETTAIEEQISLLKNIPSFGYDNLVADWQYIDLVQYAGDDNRGRVGYGALMDYFEHILDRDPRFLNTYFLMGGTASIFAGEARKAVEIANKNLPLLAPKTPDRAYYIWRMKSVEELLFLGRSTDAKNSLLMAAEWTKPYAKDDKDSADEAANAGRVSLQAAADLAKDKDSKQARFEAWNMVISSAVDPRAVQIAITEIQALGGRVKISQDGKIETFPPPKDRSTKENK
jgi:hypothetical protein